MVQSLIELNDKTNFELRLLTDINYFGFMNRFLPRKTSDLVSRTMGPKLSNVEVVPWNLSNLIREASQSTLSIIPLNVGIPIQYYKPENRLLIMWRLGLPTLTTAIPSYMRVSDAIHERFVCDNQLAWLQMMLEYSSDSDRAYEQVKLGQNYLRTQHNGEVLLQKWDEAVASIL